MNISKQSGFTLVELSIVIIRFLIAGVAAGTNLIKQASLRSVISDMQGFIASYNNFFSRYNKIPGDMDTAYSYWQGSCAASASFCNGNNNGIIDRSNNNPALDEVNKAWNHLYNAAMIANTSIQPVTSVTTNLGTNGPVSRIAGAGYIMVGNSGGIYGVVTNYVNLGKLNGTDNTLSGSAITPIDAFAIDQKADDGRFDANSNAIGAATGAWRARDGIGSTAGGCITDQSKGIYNISNNVIACGIAAQLNSAATV